jgi:hypothetical protein
MRAMLVGFFVHCSECSRQLQFENGQVSPGQSFPSKFKCKCSNPACKEFDKWYWMQTPAMEMKLV